MVVRRFIRVLLVKKRTLVLGIWMGELAQSEVLSDRFRRVTAVVHLGFLGFFLAFFEHRVICAVIYSFCGRFENIQPTVEDTPAFGAKSRIRKRRIYSVLNGFRCQALRTIEHSHA